MHSRRTDPERLRDLIADRHMTLKAFGVAVGYSESMVSYILATPPRRDFSDSKARLAAEVLGCTLDDFTKPYTRPARKSRRTDAA